MLLPAALLFHQDICTAFNRVLRNKDPTTARLEHLGVFSVLHKWNVHVCNWVRSLVVVCGHFLWLSRTWKMELRWSLAPELKDLIGWKSLTAVLGLYLLFAF